MVNKYWLVIGHARHGKDTFCEILRNNHGLNFRSSSYAAAAHAVYPALSAKYGYASIDDCFEDRVNHRAEWKSLIKAFNTPNLTRLADRIYADNPVYCGLRDREEFEAIRAKYQPLIIWVDGSKRHPPEPADSMQLTEDDAEVVIDNNGSLALMHIQINALCSAL
jgi:hypothetical protein